MKILVINGPNINMLGIREPDIYGSETYDDLQGMVHAHCAAHGIEVEMIQSNYEGALVGAIQSAYGAAEGIIINPAAYTHTSIALLDALKAVGLPAVEVHLTDPDTREPFRQVSYVRDACIATVKGKGIAGYIEAIDILRKYLGK